MILLRRNGRKVIRNPAKDKADRALEAMPPAGPHDRPELTNYDACPGCGMFPAQKPSRGLYADPGGG